MNVDQQDASTCSDCGLPQSDGVPACRALFDEVLAQHFENPAYFGVHRLFVDVYCLQHPDRGCISFKSFAAHAAHLCWSVERGGSRAVPSEPIRHWVERHPQLEKPALPRGRGTMDDRRRGTARTLGASRCRVALGARRVGRLRESSRDHPAVGRPGICRR
jgi:hypothetical protein